MEPSLKKILRGISLDLRHTLEGWHDKKTGDWNPGDLERRLNEIGVWSDRPSKPLDEMPHLSAEDKAARRLVDGYLQLRAGAGVERAAAVAEFVRESAYTWANRLFALRCMEARDIIDEVILQKAAYAGRSLAHQRFLRKNPDAAKGEDDGLFAVLFAEFAARSQELPALFDPKSPAVALRPSVAALKRCVALLSGTETVRGQDPAKDDVFAASDAFGWAYQYWNADEKDRVFEMVRTKKGAKIQGADIIPATQIYTEPYMVKFLVQNSLGALWVGMYPDSKLCEQWEYFVKDADRVPVTRKSVREITFLDPAQGSGHFHLEAFDLFYAMYEEEAARESRTLTPCEIVAAILNHNLYGIDVDGRSVQIATAALWMKAKERAPKLEANDLTSFHEHLVATNIRLPKGKDHLEHFLQKHPEDKDLRPALEFVFQGLEHADELGALLQIEEPVNAVLRQLKTEADGKKGTAVQQGLFDPTLTQGTLPVSVEDYDKWKRDALNRLRAHFEAEAQAADAVQAFFGEAAGKGLSIFTLLSVRYDVVAANPPYMGSKNMCESIRSYVDLHFKRGKNDLFAAMLLRCESLSAQGGRVACVIPETWMFLSSYVQLRMGDGLGILEVDSIEVLAQMGRHAFSEADPPTNVCMFVLSRRAAQTEHRVTCFRVTKSRPAEEQAALLREAMIGEGKAAVYRPMQAEFFDIPLSPICYWLSENIMRPFREGKPIKLVAECKVTCKTSDNSKFVRFWWESPRQNPRWKRYEKESVGLRFLSSPLFTLDWSSGAQRFYRNHFSAQLPSGEFLFRESIVSSKIKRPNVTARVLEDIALADMAVNQIFPNTPERITESLCALLNSSVAVYYLRLLNPTVNCHPIDLERIPLAQLMESDRTKSELAAEWLNSSKVIEDFYKLSLLRHQFAVTLSEYSNFDGFIGERRAEVESLWAKYAACLQRIDAIVGTSLGLGREDWEAIQFDINVSADEDVTSDNGEEVDFSDYAVAEEFPKEAEVILGDFLTAIVLHLLGHRWPKQIGADEALPAWVDGDGVIPVTSDGGETPLIERVRKRLAEDFPGGNVAALEREFEEIVGVSLEQWLAGPFFERHLGQFKKRPIAWQLETVAVRQTTVPGSKGKKKRAAAGEPVFACLVYYHKLDLDILPKIRTQYVGLLSSGFEAELRTLERLANPTGDQQARRLQLEQWTDELQTFDRLLEDVSLRGFGPDALRPALRQHGINDALLSLTASWLRRLSETIAEGPLAEWVEASAKADLHPDLPKWLHDSMSKLNHFCAVLGPRLPAEKSFETDPTSRDLAPVVARQAHAMVEGSLKLGCDRWWKSLDQAVLDRLRQQIKAAKTEIETIDKDLKTEGLPYQRRNELGERKHELREKVKSLKSDHDEKSDRAKKIRSQVENWASPEAETWEAWLSAQPLFDPVASLDGQRPPPQSIADFITQESRYAPDINDGVRVNIAPLQKAGLLHANVLDPKDADKAIADRAEWRADERRWVREGKLPQPGWWKANEPNRQTRNITLEQDMTHG